MSFGSWTWERRDTIRRLTEAGASAAEVGAAVGLSRGEAGRHMKRVRAGDSRYFDPKAPWIKQMVVKRGSRCGRCGLRGAHECLDVANFMRRGSNEILPDPEDDSVSWGAFKKKVASLDERGPLDKPPQKAMK